MRTAIRSSLPSVSLASGAGLPMKGRMRSGSHDVALGALLVWLSSSSSTSRSGIGARGLAEPGWKVAYNGLIFAAARRLPPRRAAPGAPRVGADRGALAAWAVGNTYWTFFLVDLDSPPYPSVSDVFWLAFYPPVYLALALLAAPRVSARTGRASRSTGRSARSPSARSPPPWSSARSPRRTRGACSGR